MAQEASGNEYRHIEHSVLAIGVEDDLPFCAAQDDPATI